MRRFLNSFKYAAAGVLHSLRTQRNMRIHFTAVFPVLGLAFYFKIGPWEFLFLIFAITLVIMAEMFNTAVEAAVDLYSRELHPLARIAKDVAAGAVLVAAINSVVVACIVFYPRLKGLSFHLGPKVKEMPLYVIPAALILVMVPVMMRNVRGGRGFYLKYLRPGGVTALAFGGCTVLALFTGSALVTTIAFIAALLVAHCSLDYEDCTFFDIISGALLGILATLAVFCLFWT